MLKVQRWASLSLQKHSIVKCRPWIDLVIYDTLCLSDANILFGSLAAVSVHYCPLMGSMLSVDEPMCHKTAWTPYHLQAARKGSSS